MVKIFKVQNLRIGLSSLTALISVLMSSALLAQPDEDKLGAWYTYAWSQRMTNSNFGWQGDVQHRNWNMGGDLEQLLTRAGLTYTSSNSGIRYTLGAANIITGAYGPSNENSEENRIYQEALISQKIGERLYFSHRLRLEQRWVENQDERNRFRYFLGLNIPLNQAGLSEGAWYLSFYDEIFVNLERNIGNNRQVDYFDRNRLYAAMGYSITSSLRFQFGYMRQTTDNWSKGQLQFNFFQSF
jgi:hypothetical protein